MHQQPVEQQAAGTRCAAVRTEGEFVKVVVQVLLPHSALVGSQQSALEQRSHSMNPPEVPLGSDPLL